MDLGLECCCLNYLTDNRLRIYERAGTRIALGLQYSRELNGSGARCTNIALLQLEEHA
jgi:hypothetical protein